MLAPTFRRPALTAFLLAGLALPALAAPPSVLDRVPADAPVVVTVRQVGDLLTDMDQVNAMLGANADENIGFATAMVRGMPGVNLDGDAAFVMLPLPEDAAQGGMASVAQVVVALLPVSDFEAFSQGRTAENGVVRLMVPDNELFARDAGDGYAIVSANADAVRDFDPAKGRLGTHTERAGAAGGRVLADAEVAVLTNADALRPFLNQALLSAKQSGEFLAMMAGEQAAVQFNAGITLAEAVIRDLQAGVFGLTVTEDGAAYDLAVQFTEGSETGAHFTEPGSTEGLLNRLPAQRYLFAYAADTGSESLRSIAGAFNAWNESLPESARSGNPFGQMSFGEISRLSTGISFVMGTPPGLMGGGLFTNTTMFIRTDDPAEYRKAIVEMFKAADGQSADGIAVKTTVTPDAVTIEGASLTSFSMTMSVDPNAGQAGNAMPGMDPTMITQMIFGPSGGPTGYLAEVKGGVVQTMTQGPEVTRRALAAAKGGENLGANDRVKRSADRLQGKRVAEFFISVDEIINTVGPTLMMFGMLPEFEPVNAMDPVAAGLSVESGGLNARVFVTHETVKTVSDMIPSEPMGGGADQDGFDF